MSLTFKHLDGHSGISCRSLYFPRLGFEDLSELSFAQNVLEFNVRTIEFPLRVGLKKAIIGSLMVDPQNYWAEGRQKKKSLGNFSLQASMWFNFCGSS